jgi:hypothetical protein
MQRKRETAKAQVLRDEQSAAILENALSDSATLEGLTQLGFLDCAGPGKFLISKRRNLRVVEGARLESETGDAHRVILKHLFAQSIQRLPATECFSM